MSLKAAERASGLPKAHISQLEVGDRLNPTFRVVADLAGAIGLSLDDLAAAIADGTTPRSSLGDSERSAIAAAGIFAQAEREASKLLATVRKGLETVQPTSSRRRGNRG